MNKQNKIINKFLLLCVLLSFSLTGCGPSDEKIAQAQEIYTQLTDIHNQVVEAHRDIDDNSLDKSLVALSEKIEQIEQYNLNELKDEQIDSLIESMNSIIGSYEEYLTAINDIKAQEEAAVLITIPTALHNNTSLTFQKLCLYRKDVSSQKSDVLENTAGLAPGQSLTGLIIYRDVSSTPWLLTLEDTNGTAYEIELSVNEYDETGVSLTLTYDSAAGEVNCS